MNMSYTIFILVLVVVTTTRSYDVQATHIDVCSTYNAQKVPWQHTALNSSLSLICSGENKLNYKYDADVVVVIGRSGTGKTTNVEILAEVPPASVKPRNNGTMNAEQNKWFDTRSNTHLPEWLTNSNTNTTFLDCPGFEDTRGPDYDIAAAHFNRMLLSNVRRVKIIMVEAYDNLVKGGEKNALGTLLRHVTTLIKDVNKFRDSIALLVSKTRPNLPEDKIFGNINKFLKGDLANNTDRNSQEKELIKILLDSSRSRIGSVRFIENFPDDLKSQGVQSDKQKLDDMINKLNFTQIQNGDFDYTVSDGSILGIQRIADEIATGISTNINFTEEFPARGQQNVSDIMQAYSDLFDVKEKLEKSEDLKQFLDVTIPDMEKKLNVKVAPSSISNIKTLQIYSNFFLEVSRNKVVLSKWSKGFATDKLKTMFSDISQRCQAKDSTTAKTTSGSSRSNQTIASWVVIFAIFLLNGLGAPALRS